MNDQERTMNDQATVTRRETIIGATRLAAASALGAEAALAPSPASAQTSPSAQTQSPQDLARRQIERRAAEAVIWGMPAVNYDLMLQEMLGKTAGKDLTSDKATWPAVFGLEQSHKDADRLIDEAFTALAPFGSHAEGLKAVARYLVERQS